MPNRTLLSSFVYQDYARYLASKGIYPRVYRHRSLKPYGQGYLLYLPEGYEAKPNKNWPLILFLCGSGERGDDVFELCRNGPYQMVREKGPIPFIVVGPMLKVSASFRSFPERYLDGVVREVMADYRVDVWTDTYTDPAFYEWLLKCDCPGS